MSALLKPVRKPLLKPLWRRQVVGTPAPAPFPLSLFVSLGGTGTWVDPLDGQTVFSDTAGTTLAALDGQVARIDAPAGAPVAASFQSATDPQRPLLRADGLEFDGVDDALSYPDDPALRFGLTDFTIAFACRPDNVSGFHGIWSKRGTGLPGSNPGWGVRQHDARLRLEFDDSGSTEDVLLANNVFAIGEPLYGIVSIDRTAGTATARVGGADFASVAIPPGDISGIKPLVIGAMNPNGALSFDGTIGRLLVIDKLLSSGDKATVEAWLQEGLS